MLLDAEGPCAARRAAHWAKNPNRTIRNSKSAVAAITAAANAFPDRGGGGYLGFSLPRVSHPAVIMVQQRSRAPDVAYENFNPWRRRIKLRDGRVPGLRPGVHKPAL